MKYKPFAALLILALGLLFSACNSASSGSSVPRVWFDAPLPGTVFWPPNPCQIVAHGASPNGIALFELSINGAATNLPSPDTTSSLVTLSRDCGLSQPGEYLLQLRAQDNAGNWSGYAETSLIIGVSETPEPTPTSAPAACVDKLAVIFEDPLQKAPMLPGQTFTKSWTVQNTGTCTWDEGYRLIFVGGPSMFEGGASMGTPLDIPLGSLVSLPVVPGQTVVIPLARTAPMTPGWYVGAWNLVAPNGNMTLITDGATTTPSMYVDIVVESGTPTPAPVGSVSIESISTNLVYLGRASCGPLEVTITARATAPNGIKVVVLFYRFSTGNSSAEFQSVAMNPIGGDLYEYTLNPTSLLGGAIPFDQATLQYQVVIQQNDGDTSIRTPVIADIAVQACGGGFVPTAVPACSSYTDQRSCEAHGCNWVEIPGIVPIYECRNP